jgi:hypothetical protein
MTSFAAWVVVAAQSEVVLLRREPADGSRE